MSQPSSLVRACGCRGRWILAAALVTLPLAGAAAISLAPEHILDRAYAPALARSEQLWPSLQEQAPILRPASLPAARNGLRKPFAVGDRMVIDSRTGSPETIEVVAIERLDGASLGLDGVMLQMVTAKAEGATSGETVRFLFAIDQPADTSKPAHAL